MTAMSAVFFAILAMTAVQGAEGARYLRTSATAQSSANPVRKVVTLLQKMQASVEAEGEKEKELFDKFMCYCKTSGSTLSDSIGAAETKLPALEADIKSSES